MKAKQYTTQPSLSFFNTSTHEVRSDIWQLLEAGLWREFNVENWMYNHALTLGNEHRQKPILGDWQCISPGLTLNPSDGTLAMDWYTPRPAVGTIDSLLETSETYFRNFEGKRLGVHLSGGMDSTLIMGILRKLGIPFVPIGLVSETYEFRTERMVQEELLGWGEDGLLISMEEYPFYSDVDQLPKHQEPTGIFKDYAGATALAKAFKERGVDVVFTGQGGDTLFVDEVKSLDAVKFNIGIEFDNSVGEDLIYAPHGLQLVSYFSHKPVIDEICSARLGQDEDLFKSWSRKWLKDFLPQRLVDYQYFADFFAMTTWGLSQARPTIKALMHECYERTGWKEFSPANTRTFLSQDIYSFEQNDYMKFCSLTAVAVWLHSLLRTDE